MTTVHEAVVDLRKSKSKEKRTYKQKDDLLKVFRELPNYLVAKNAPRFKGYGNTGHDIYYKNRLVARHFRRHEFYNFLQSTNLTWHGVISKQIIPEEVLLVNFRRNLLVIDRKFQTKPKSVNRRVFHICDFKRRQFQKLVQPLDLWVDYVFVLDNDFRGPKYRDELKYAQSVSCHYVYGEISLAWIGLPTDDYGPDAPGPPVRRKKQIRRD